MFYAEILRPICQSSFISFATPTARPLLKLKSSVLLVMYNWLNGFYRAMNGKYSVTLLLMYEAIQDKSLKVYFIFHNVHSVLYYPWA